MSVQSQAQQLHAQQSQHQSRAQQSQARQSQHQAQAQRRARMRSRRGLLELDLLLVPFSESMYAALSPAEQASYDAMLGEDDVVLLDWLKGVAAPDQSAGHIVGRIREWHRAQGAKL